MTDGHMVLIYVIFKLAILASHLCWMRLSCL